MKAIVSQKGQVTIPKAIRRRLGILPGSVLTFEADQGRLVARKADDKEDPILAVTGIIKDAVDVDAYLEETRGRVE